MYSARSMSTDMPESPQPKSPTIVEQPMLEYGDAPQLLQHIDELIESAHSIPEMNAIHDEVQNLLTTLSGDNVDNVLHAWNTKKYPTPQTEALIPLTPPSELTEPEQQPIEMPQPAVATPKQPEPQPEDTTQIIHHINELMDQMQTIHTKVQKLLNQLAATMEHSSVSSDVSSRHL